MPDTYNLDDFAEFCETLTLDTGQKLVLEAFERTLLRDYFDGTMETVVISIFD